jgi:ATP-dependent Clp protease adaptor protein ClpS
MAENNPKHQEQEDVREKPKTQRPRKFKVIFHNDDYTSMQFVIEALRAFFQKSETEALHIMLTVHHKGSAVVGVYPRDVAETKVALATDEAQKRGMPLMITTEPEDSSE